MGRLGIRMAMAIDRDKAHGEREKRLVYKHGMMMTPALTSAEPRRGGCACILGGNRRNMIPAASRLRPLGAAKAKGQVITISYIAIRITIRALTPPTTITSKRGDDTDQLDRASSEEAEAQPLGGNAPGKEGATVPTARP